MPGGVVADGGTFVATTSPGCWGPMITPEIPSGHEVSAPLFVEGAMPGDSVAIVIEKIDLLSEFAASGTARRNEKNFGKDPSIHAYCPHCGVYYPETVVRGIGDDAICCKACGNPIIPQTFESGYTVACDAALGLGVSVDLAAAEKIAQDAAAGKAFLPAGSRQHLATVLARADVDQMVLRARPMIGNIGCSPRKEIPSAKNSGDLLAGLNASELFGKIMPQDITDAHMDICSVGEGCVVLSPVLVEGGGVYVGDVHFTQGYGELAGHTLDVSARVHGRVFVLKNLALDGPMLLPIKSELNSRFVPLSDAEQSAAAALRARFCADKLEKSWPVQFIGTGNGINEAIDCAIARAAKLLDMPLGEVRNRATVTGCAEIGRFTGSVYLTLMLTESMLERCGLLKLVKEQYDR